MRYIYDHCGKPHRSRNLDTTSEHLTAHTRTRKCASQPSLHSSPSWQELSLNPGYDNNNNIHPPTLFLRRRNSITAINRKAIVLKETTFQDCDARPVQGNGCRPVDTNNDGRFDAANCS
ncbi:hypothetical protein AC578_902 [Pseudocercospora eumusae]|uniref:Uncharacterized protein n=1 Tax=Pseudocercospora eumusae TaxID=321146 RepID=A0A139HBV9_9PEZI|nr:hypothetical protein AC578_902 [Pseudocercospora eumusae]